MIKLFLLLFVAEGHVCPFELCPYKGYTDFPGVIHTYSDVIEHSYKGLCLYRIDSLHFVYPSDSYDDLEDKIMK